jgi:sulfotransferase
MHFVEYQDLVKRPEETLKKLYEFLGEEYYEHDFDNLENQNREQDINTYGLADMHEVRPKLKSTAPNPSEVLSSYVLEKCNGMDIWRPQMTDVSIPKYINTDSNQLQIVN